MKADERRDKLINILNKAGDAVSGSVLADELKVSRQIIVKDINKLKEEGVNILSTPKGYKLDKNGGVRKIVKVRHDDKDIMKELILFVDFGVEVEDVFIYHKIYNEIHAKLCIRTRRDVMDFCDRLKSGKSGSLSTATAGYHYHTVIARDMDTLKQTLEALHEEGFLAEPTEYEPEGLVSWPL